VAANPATVLSSPGGTNTGFYQVVRLGVHLFGVTNGQRFSGIVSLPVEIGLPSMAEVPMDVALAPVGDNEEDTRPAGVELYFLNETNRTPSLRWDTHRATNGTYVLQAAVTLQGDTVVTGAPLSVIVSNQIQAPKLPEVIVSGLPIHAIIDQPAANYTITIRNHLGQIVRTLTGQAVNNVITDFWNGLDDFGNNALVDGRHVDVTISYNPSYTFRVWVFFEDDDLDGLWLIAYQKGLYSPLNEVRLDTALQQVATFAADEGLLVNPYLQIRSGPADWSSLSNDLAFLDARNFYYWGHGGPSTLGFGSNDRANGLNADKVQAVLGNRLVTNEIQIRHAFRFVWLDNCQGGTESSAWPQTFGIQPVQLSAQDFANAGAASRAFLGWENKIATIVFENSRIAFAEDFFENWISNGENLSAALDSAAVGTIGSDARKKLRVWGDPQLMTQGAFP
jgi:hypothetical protein